MPGKFMLQIRGALFRILGISLPAFLYRTITFCHAAFQQTSSEQAREDPSPTTPHPHCLTAAVRFALCPFYSPLLRTSLLISLLLPTKMLHFRRFLWLSPCLRKNLIRVSRGRSLHAANPGISQLTTPFLSVWSQAIHQVDNVD